MHLTIKSITIDKTGLKLVFENVKIPDIKIEAVRYNILLEIQKPTE